MYEFCARPHLTNALDLVVHDERIIRSVVLGLGLALVLLCVARFLAVVLGWLQRSLASICQMSKLARVIAVQDGGRATRQTCKNRQQGK